jgi:hypothetical protein
MTKNAKDPSRGPRSYTIGRIGFARIGEVEGIKPSRGLEEDFRAFDRQGLSAEQRRRILAAKYGRKA